MRLRGQSLAGGALERGCRDRIKHRAANETTIRGFAYALAEPLDWHIAAIVLLEQFRDLSPRAESMQSNDDKDDDDNSEEQHPP
jgi:hypothetical protein